MIKKNDKIFLAGHNGLVGSAVLRKLKDKSSSHRPVNKCESKTPFV